MFSRRGIDSPLNVHKPKLVSNQAAATRTIRFKSSELFQTPRAPSRTPGLKKPKEELVPVKPPRFVKTRAPSPRPADPIIYGAVPTPTTLAAPVQFTPTLYKPKKYEEIEARYIPAAAPMVPPSSVAPKSAARAAYLAAETFTTKELTAESPATRARARREAAERTAEIARERAAEAEALDDGTRIHVLGLLRDINGAWARFREDTAGRVAEDEVKNEVIGIERQLAVPQTFEMAMELITKTYEKKLTRQRRMALMNRKSVHT